MPRVLVRRDVLDQIARHARDEAPNECCGLLIGTAESVRCARRARNVHASRTRFLIDPEDHFAALRQARARAEEVVGAYHSHPASAPVPSATDVADANDPRLIHLIVSLEDDVENIRAFRYLDGNFEPLELVSVE